MIFRLKERPGFDEDVEREKIKQHKKEWNAGAKIRKKILSKNYKPPSKDTKLYKKFFDLYSKDEIKIFPSTNLVGLPALRINCIDDLKKIKKKTSGQDDIVFFRKAIGSSVIALDIAWTHDMIGVRFANSDQLTTFMGKAGTIKGDWRDLVK